MMNTRFSEQLRVRLQETSRKHVLVLFGVVCTLVIVLILSHIPRDRPPVITESVFPASSMPYLHNQTIYSYNGSAFLATNISTTSTKVLFSGRYLPTVKNLVWADDSGVAVEFSDYADYTFFEEPIRQQLASIYYENSTLDGLWWYLDFKTESLHLINEEVIIEKTLFWSEREKRFYFAGFDSRPGTYNNVTDTMDGDGGVINLSTVFSYNPADYTKKTIGTLANTVGRVPSASKCHTYIVCYIAVDLNESRYYLYGVNSTSITTLYSSEDMLQPTNDPTLFSKWSVVKSAEKHSETEYVDLGPSTLVFYNTVTKKTSKPYLSTADQSAYTQIFNNTIYTIDSVGEKVFTHYKTRSILNTPLTIETTTHIDAVTDILGTNQNMRTALINGASNKTFLQTPAPHKNLVHKQLNALDIYRRCMSSDQRLTQFDIKSSDQDIVVLGSLQKDYVAAFKSFGDCFYADPSAVIGYTIKYAVIIE